jgi:hypothetical protein
MVPDTPNSFKIRTITYITMAMIIAVTRKEINPDPVKIPSNKVIIVMACRGFGTIGNATNFNPLQEVL